MPEILEHKLKFTPDLRCEKQTDLVPVCYSCKSCIVSWKIFSTREWFMRASHTTQRQFLVGIIKRLKKRDLLKYVWNILQSVNGKDFTYTRSCVSSNLTASSTLDRALDPRRLEQAMTDLWRWFLSASFWTKANYMLLLLRMCDSRLLLMAANLIHILLAQDERKTSKKVVIGAVVADDEEYSVKEHPKSASQAPTHLTSLSTGRSSPCGSLSTEKSSRFGHVRKKRVLPRETDQFSGGKSETEEEPSYPLASPYVIPVITLSPQPLVISKCKDFIRCLPVHLSKYILGMLDQKTLTRCIAVSEHWAFLIKQIRKDNISYRALRHEIGFLKRSCPKGAVPNYAKIVKIAIPLISKDGDIVPAKRQKYKLPLPPPPPPPPSKELEHMHKAYHGLMTDAVKLEERNVYCSSYNVCVLIDCLDPNRVIHYSGGKLLAIGSGDRKIRFLDVTEVKEVAPVLVGHAGSIRALSLNEQKGFLLSGSYDLSIRMWNIITGACVKIFNGHSGTITCLDMYKNKFVSGAKDCTAKMWDIETGKCMKTFRHRGVVLAAKMNDTHVVSCCDRGMVKVWHVETYLLIKSLDGHLGPVRCLSFDKWHLVTGSDDGYILGWSLVGNHRRCLMAFRHPMEVLNVGFLYLRVISGCADGKIRIFNFLTGTCLRVMRANSRGDPVMSYCIVENRLLINARGSVVMFQFEEVKWDRTLNYDRLTRKKEARKYDDISLRVKPSPNLQSERQKRLSKNTWKLYSTKKKMEKVSEEQVVVSYFISKKSAKGSRGSLGLQYEVVKELPERTSSKMRTNVGSTSISAEDRKRLSYLARICQETPDSEDSDSLSTLKGSSDDESGYESPAPVSTFGQNAESLLKYIKKQRILEPMSKDQALLTVSTTQHAYKTDQVSVNMAYNMKIKDAWGPICPQKDQPKKMMAPKTPKQQKMDPASKLKRLKAVNGTRGMERISTPYETKTLQLNLKTSLVGGNVQSFIPAPTITRSKSCSNLSGGKNISTGQAKIPFPPTGGAQLIGHFMSSCESIKVPRMKIGQPATEVGSHTKKHLFSLMPNPYRLNAGFRILTTQQIKEYNEAKVSEYQANQTKVIEDRQKVCKNAWLRKIKGLPIENFTKEGTIAAPELGDNVFI